jgi:Asp-tRNA(Asn)/Glu-tRNA(Gln) amidotransferase C subunit
MAKKPKPYVNDVNIFDLAGSEAKADLIEMKNQMRKHRNYADASAFYCLN